MDGFVFGFIDNAVLIVGAVTGYEVERFLPKRLQVGLGAVVGAGIGNTVSDLLGAVVDPALTAMAGSIVLGCLAPMLVIPLIPAVRRIFK
jgi:hypothetical protein